MKLSSAPDQQKTSTSSSVHAETRIDEEEEEEELKFEETSSPMFVENEVFDEDRYKEPAEYFAKRPTHRVRLSIPVRRTRNYSTPYLKQTEPQLQRRKTEYDPKRHSRRFGAGTPMQPNKLQSFYIGKEHQVFTGHSFRKAEEQFGSTAPLSLQERQQAFADHIKVTRDILKEQTEELIKGEECDPVHQKTTLKEVARRIQEQQSKSPKLANLVFQLMHKIRSESTDMVDGDVELSSSLNATTPASLPVQPSAKKSNFSMRRQLSVQSLSNAVPISTLRRTHKLSSRKNLQGNQEQKQGEGSGNGNPMQQSDTELSPPGSAESSPAVLSKAPHPSILKQSSYTYPDDSPISGSSQHLILKGGDRDEL